VGGEEEDVTRRPLSAPSQRQADEAWRVLSEWSGECGYEHFGRAAAVALCRELRKLQADNSRLRLIIEDLVNGRYHPDGKPEAKDC
jgi:hypothetical protein